MKQPKLLFDECISRNAANHIKQFAENYDKDKNHPQIGHVLEFQREGVWDDEWIPERAKEGWILISQDRGKGGTKKGAKLPHLCTGLGMTHILLSPAVASRRTEDKILTILDVWPEILHVCNAPPGSRFILEPVHCKKGETSPPLNRGKLRVSGL